MFCVLTDAYTSILFFDAVRTSSWVRVSQAGESSKLPSVFARYVSASAGYGHSILLRDDGAAVAFGNDGFGQCQVPELPAGTRSPGREPASLWFVHQL